MVVKDTQRNTCSEVAWQPGEAQGNIREQKSQGLGKAKSWGAARQAEMDASGVVDIVNVALVLRVILGHQL